MIDHQKPVNSIARKLAKRHAGTRNPCMAHPYRTASGYCNNLEHPEWGSSFRRFTRLLPADYDDGKLLLYSKHT